MPKQRDFLEEITKLNEILNIGLQQSRRNRKERLSNEDKPKEKEKTPSEELQEKLEPIDD